MKDREKPKKPELPGSLPTGKAPTIRPDKGEWRKRDKTTGRFVESEADGSRAKFTAYKAHPVSEAIRTIKERHDIGKKPVKVKDSETVGQLRKNLARRLEQVRRWREIATDYKTQLLRAQEELSAFRVAIPDEPIPPEHQEIAKAFTAHAETLGAHLDSMVSSIKIAREELRTAREELSEIAKL